jgi:glutathione synthase/RimK-type ligase-like ATP-grasp enzyme
MKKIAILSTAPTIKNESYNVAEFNNELKTRLSSKFNVEIILFSDLIISIDSKNFSIKIMPGEQELSDYDFVFFKSWVRLPELAHVIAEYLSLNSVPFEPSELKYHHSHSKLSESVAFHREGFLFPDTFYTINPRLLKDKYLRLKNIKIVLKDADAFGGQDNHLVNNLSEFEELISTKKEINYIMQPFISNQFDYRIFMMGDEKPLIIKRTRKGTTHLNNTSMGAEAEICGSEELNESIIDKAQHLAKLMNRSFAGVDIMVGDDGRYYFLEINKSPQVASGAFIDSKINLFANGLADVAEKYLGVMK